MAVTTHPFAKYRILLVKWNYKHYPFSIIETQLAH